MSNRKLLVAACAAAIATAGASGQAYAQERGDLTWGAFLGGQTFSSNAQLGTPPDGTSFASSATVGGRVGYYLYPWLTPELELAITPTTTRDGEATIGVFTPRLQGRFDVYEVGDLRAFGLLGGGAPVSLSTRNSIAKGGDIVWAGHVGAGASFEPSRGLSFRIDARYQLVPARGDDEVAHEFGFMVTIYRAKKPDRGPRPLDADELAALEALEDPDGDGITGDDDECPDRPEDFDKFEDDNGCPDIDNDFDGELDIADQCPMIPETHNGFKDTDGCPDEVPDEVAALEGPIARIAFKGGALAGGSGRALNKIVAVLEAYPSVRIEVAGHTDDSFEEEEEAFEVSIQRAEAVRQYFLDKGIKPHRITATGLGPSEPIGDNETRAGRRANNRVELKLRYRVRDN